MEDVVKTLHSTAAVRILRGELMALASQLARDPSRAATLRLVDPRISEKRLEDEWSAATLALRPAVLSRLSLQVRFADGRSRVFGAPAGSPPEIEVEKSPREGKRMRLPSRDLSFAVEKLLVWAWLTRQGPLTRNWLERTVGCTYPTVAAVVERLGSAVHRHRDRRIELKYIPREEWARLFARSGEARSTLRFADRSGRPPTAGELLQRLQRLAPTEVAVGGVEGARHYMPALDLVGIPRIDLSVHAPGRDVDTGFVPRLDPALQAVRDPAEPAQIVLHFVRHSESLFAPHSGGLPWGDVVECLFDLHEAGFEHQAVEFLEALTPKGVAGR